MYYDALTLAAVAAEMREQMLGGRVQKIVQPSELTLGLEIYAGRRYQVLLSAEAERPGVYLLEIKQRRGLEAPSPLLLLLWKYVRDSALEAIEQQPALERVLRLRFKGAYGPVDLLCEIMGRYSNLILLDLEGQVMEALKRVPASINRYRTILPKQPYVPPPAQAKGQIGEFDAPSLTLALGQRAGQPLWRQLVEAVAGVSPILGRELAFRATGAVDTARLLLPAEQERLLLTLRDLLSLPQSGAWAPSVGYIQDEEGRWPVDYAPYELTHYVERERVASISAAIQRVLEAARPLDAYKQVRLRLHGLISAQLERQQARLAALQRSLAAAEEAECSRAAGQAILALAWTLHPRQAELVVEPEQWAELGEAASPQAIRIPLDPALSPSENAQRYFRDYRKQQAATAEVPALIAQVELEIAYLEQLHAEADLAENRPQLDTVEHEFDAAGYAPSPVQAKPGKAKSIGTPLSLHSAEGVLILVGRNSLQNDQVTFRRASADDLWLHAHGVPGSHVIIKSGGAAVAEATLQMAARLAAYYSAARHEARVQVDYTARRYVRHIKGGRPGMVMYSHEQTLVTEPGADQLSGPS